MPYRATKRIEQPVTASIQDLQYWKNRSVLVTGCSGFIGGILSDALLAAGASVVGLLRNPERDCYLTRTGLDHHERMTLLSGDLLDQTCVHDVLAEHPVDAVFHLAGEAILGKGDGPDVYALNLTITNNLLQAIKANRSKAVFLLASTDMVYGPGSTRPFDETMSPQPHNPYAKSKYESEMLVTQYVERGDLVAGIVRLSNVYGGGDLNFSRLIPGTVCEIFAGETPKLRSDGQSVRDFIHVDDVVRGFLKFSAALSQGKPNGEVYNIAAGQSVRVIDVVTQMLEAAACADRTPVLGSPDMRSDAQRHLSINKARSDLDWAPLISLEQGLAMTIDWYENAGFVSKGDA